MRSSRDGLTKAVAEYSEHRRRRQLARGTLVRDRYDLGRFLDYCRGRGIDEPAAVTPAVMDDFLVYLSKTYRCRSPGGRGQRLKQATLVHTVHTVRALFGFLVREGRVLLDPGRELVLHAPERHVMERVLEEEQLEAMLRSCRGRTALRLRNRAMLEVLFGCGLRRSELAALDLYDVDLAGHVVHVQRGKGGKSRLVPVDGKAWRAVARYIEEGRPRLASKRSGPALFLGEWGRRLGGARIYGIVVETARRAGLLRRVATHDLRHGYATALVRGGADVRVVQKLLGHARIDTTEVYTHVSVEDLRRIHRRTHPRERRP